METIKSFGFVLLVSLTCAYVLTLLVSCIWFGRMPEGEECQWVALMIVSTRLSVKELD